MRIKGETPRAQQSLARGSRGGAMTSWFTVSGVHTNPKRNRVDLKPHPRVVSEVYGFGQRIRRLCVDGRANRTRPLRFRHEIGFVWTGPQT